MRPLKHPLSVIHPVKTERGLPAPWHKNTVGKKKSLALRDLDSSNENGMDEASEPSNRALSDKGAMRDMD